jgi:hypothetical protein
MPSDDDLIDAFTDAIRERLEADEFERLMLDERAEGLGSLNDNLDLLDLRMRNWAAPASALADLKTRRALERLRARYPELWEQAAMSSGAVDA